MNVAAGILIVALAAAVTSAAAQPPPGAEPSPPPAARPVLWRGLAAGMSPREVQGALRAQGIRAELRADEKNGRPFVEAPGAIAFAGRPTQMAFGFVDDRLFWVETGSQRALTGRIRFDHSHFTRVAALLAEQYGPARSIDAAPSVGARSGLGHVETARATFERNGVRADLVGYTSYPGRLPTPILENVDVRYWRAADAEAFAASEAAQTQRPPPR
jgi:hypothetical protein